MEIFGINISKKRGATERVPISVAPAAVPVGKQSKTTAESVSTQFSAYAGLEPPNTKIWEYLEAAYLYNPDISAAVQIIVSLASTQHDIVSETGDDLSPRALEIIEDFCYRCYPLAGGLDGLILAQLNSYAKYGALSGEAEIERPLRIKQVWSVPIPQVRWKFENGEYRPYQKLPAGTDLIPLNLLTYRYICAEFWRTGEPYAKPPMTGAVDAIIRGDNILNNVDYIVRKLGLLGGRDIEFELLPPDEGDYEGSPEHLAKNVAFQKEIERAEKEHERDAVRVHSDNIKYDLVQIASDTRGLEAIYKMNEEQISAGTGIAEALFGRSRQTTEAFSNVMYSLARVKAETAQRLAGQFVAYFINLELALHGIAERVAITFEDISALDSEKEAKAELIRLQTIGFKESRYYITHEQAVREAGYDEVPELPVLSELPAPEKESAETRLAGIIRSSQLAPELPGRAGRLFQDYVRAVGRAADIATDYTDASLETFLMMHRHTDFADDADFATQLFTAIGGGWANAAPEFREAVDGTARTLYRYFILEDRSYWRAGGAPVTFTFGEGAEALVSFATRFEPQLLTTLWSDPTRNSSLALQRFLKEQFMERGADIFRRTNPEAYSAFRSAFSRELGHLSDYQIRRIQDTFVMRCRNGSMLEQLYQADVRLTKIGTTVTCCEICEPFEGKVFDVRVQHSALMNQMSLSEDAYLEHLRSGSEIIKTGDWDSMVEAGLCLPPFHPGCFHDLIEEIV